MDQNPLFLIYIGNLLLKHLLIANSGSLTSLESPYLMVCRVATFKLSSVFDQLDTKKRRRFSFKSCLEKFSNSGLAFCSERNL